MISASKRSSLRLTLQPFTPHISLSGCQSPRVRNMVSISSSTVPCTPRLSPVPDVYMASPTPTTGSFTLTPTRLGSPLQDPRSPILSICISDDCNNAVIGERSACGECRSSIHAILARAPLRSVTASRPAEKQQPLKTLKDILSASHPHPIPAGPLTSPVKPITRLDKEQEPQSPDALYFGAGRRKRRPSGLVRSSRPVESKRPLLSLARSRPQQAIPEGKTEWDESWLEQVDA